LAWFGFSVWCLFRLEKAFIPATFKGLVLGLGKAALLFSIVIVLMAVIVFPMVLLATSLPGIFSGLVLGGGLVLMVWILVRKYRTMIRLDIADTRVRSREDWPSLGLRWLFHTAVRPFLILAALVAYVYGLALFGVAPFFGGLILVVLTLACMWLTKAVRALPWMGGSE
nr:hypothetical protein [Spirochaetota bacterium]